MMERLWLIKPPPHVALHEFHVLHMDTSQSMGHGEVLHSCVCDKAGHETPPKALVVVMSRNWVLVPPPQRAVQAPNSLKSPTTQSTGQSWVLQFSV
jgi:hypothetical protein